MIMHKSQAAVLDDDSKAEMDKEAFPSRQTEYKAVERMVRGGNELSAKAVRDTSCSIGKTSLVAGGCLRLRLWFESLQMMKV
jgi:hypothetical protein